MTARSAPRIFYGASLGLALAVGALQMFRVRGGFVTNYGADLLGTAWLYALFRQGRTVFQRGKTFGPEMTALLVFAGCAASEFAQRVGALPGRYDPFDLAAYAAATIACYVLDRFIPLA
jgi:hypothetical protein